MSEANARLAESFTVAALGLEPPVLGERLESRSRSSSRCHPSPTRLVKSRASRRLSSRMNRLGVTPFVTLQNLSGVSAAKSRITVSFSSLECSADTPLTR